MRILCLIPDMGPGGAQRVMAHLISHLARRHEVVLMTWEAPDVASFYPLPEAVAIVRGDRLGGVGVRRTWRILTRFAAIRRQIATARYDVALSFMDTMNLTAILGCLGTGVPVVVSERVDPARHRIGMATSLARRLLYPLAQCCVVQTPRVAAFFARPPRPRLAVIANPVPLPPMQAQPAVPGKGGRWRVISLGRLAHQKGFDNLIEAFARLAPGHPDWDLVIFGEGPARDELEARIRKAGLGGRVTLPGVIADPIPELAVSHIMAFPSRYEGFPNAVAEGLAVGLPAIGNAGVSGVEDLIVNGATGLLVDSKGGPFALAVALERLMNDAGLRARLGAEARRHVARWAPDVVHQQWDDLLEPLALRTARASIREGMDDIRHSRNC